MQFHADSFPVVFLLAELLFFLGNLGVLAAVLRPASFLPNACAQLLAYFLVAPIRVMVTGLLLVRLGKTESVGDFCGLRSRHSP
jgi:hypothetical protein